MAVTKLVLVKRDGTDNPNMVSIGNIVEHLGDMTAFVGKRELLLVPDTHPLFDKIPSVSVATVLEKLITENPLDDTATVLARIDLAMAATRH